MVTRFRMTITSIRVSIYDAPASPLNLSSFPSLSVGSTGRVLFRSFLRTTRLCVAFFATRIAAGNSQSFLFVRSYLPRRRGILSPSALLRGGGGSGSGVCPMGFGCLFLPPSLGEPGGVVRRCLAVVHPEIPPILKTDSRGKSGVAPLARNFLRSSGDRTRGTNLIARPEFPPSEAAGGNRPPTAEVGETTKKHRWRLDAEAAPPSKA